MRTALVRFGLRLLFVLIGVLAAALVGCAPVGSPSVRSSLGGTTVGDVGSVPRSSESAAVMVEFVDETSSGYQFTTDEQSRVEAIATRTSMGVRSLLPDLPTDLRVVVAAVDDTGLISDDRDAGSVRLDEGQIYVRWEVQPGPDIMLETIADASLRGVLFHEWHHVTRNLQREIAMQTELIDNVVAEGLATAFARDAAGHEPPHAAYPDDVSSWADELLNHGSMDEYGEWMWLHPDGRRWIGYRVGTWIVDRAMRASGSSAAELVYASTSEILDLADIPTDR